MPKGKKDEAIVITRVRNLRKSIKIEYTQGTDDYVINCHDNPLPSFYKALAGLKEHVCSLCDFPAKDSEKIEPTGITVSPKGDNELALIVARKKIKRGKRVFNISTPLLAMREDAENKSADHMTEDEARAIDKVVKEAVKYVSGDRAQGQIQFEAEEKGEGNPEDPAQLKLVEDEEKGAE